MKWNEIIWKNWWNQCNQWKNYTQPKRKNLYGHVSWRGPPRWLHGRESACDAGDTSLIPRSGGSPGGGHGNPFQYFCLENPMDRGAWQVTVHRVTKSWTQLSNWACTQARKLEMTLACSGLVALQVEYETCFGGIGDLRWGPRITQKT